MTSALTRFGNVLGRLNPSARSPFERGRKKMIIHCTHHKMGSTWLAQVLRVVSERFRMGFRLINERENDSVFDHDVVFINHSDVPLAEAPDFVGSHMIRDLRDVVVSGYFYHLWTDEEWARVPNPKYGGLSYQAQLTSMDQERGLAYEIEHLAQYALNRKMHEWNYDDPRFHEIKYEEIFGDQEGGFRRLFQHYGFNSRAIEESVRIALKFGFDRLARSEPGQRAKSHLRSGKSGQWQEVFSDDHKQLFKQRLGDLLIKQGYATDSNW